MMGRRNAETKKVGQRGRVLKRIDSDSSNLSKKFKSEKNKAGKSTSTSKGKSRQPKSVAKSQQRSIGKEQPKLKSRETNKRKQQSPKNECTCKMHFVWHFDETLMRSVRMTTGQHYGQRIIRNMQSAGFLRGTYVCSSCYRYFREKLDSNQPHVQVHSENEKSSSTSSSIKKGDPFHKSIEKFQPELAPIPECDVTMEETLNRDFESITPSTDPTIKETLETLNNLSCQADTTTLLSEISASNNRINDALSELNAVLEASKTEVMDTNTGKVYFDINLLGRSLKLIGKTLVKRL